MGRVVSSMTKTTAKTTATLEVATKAGKLILHDNYLF